MPERLLFKVDFVHEAGDCIEIGCYDGALDLGYRAGDLVELRKPNGGSMQLESSMVLYSMEPSAALANQSEAIVNQSGAKPVALSFSGISGDAVPIGTEVWMLVEPPVPLKGKNFEYVGEPNDLESSN